MGLQELKADAKINRERMLAIDPDAPGALAELIAQLANNVWPWGEALVGAIEEDVLVELGDLGEAVDELIDRSESILHPEVAAQIMGALELGKALALEFEKILKEDKNDVRRRKLANLVSLYRQQCEVATATIAAITVEIEVPGEGAEDGGEGDEDADDGGDEEVEDDLVEDGDDAEDDDAAQAAEE